MKSEKGYTLVVVLMVLVVMTVLGISIIGLSINNSKMTKGEQNDQSVFYIAESGVNYALARISGIATKSSETKIYEMMQTFLTQSRLQFIHLKL